MLFKFQSFREATEPRRINVRVLSKSRRPVSVLHVAVKPQAIIVDQTFRFWTEESQFMKRSIRLPPRKGPAGGAALFVKCSNPEVVCDSRATGPAEPLDIVLKYACGPTPAVEHFFLFLFGGPKEKQKTKQQRIHKKAMAATNRRQRNIKDKRSADYLCRLRLAV